MKTGYLITYYNQKAHKRIVYQKPGSRKSCFDKRDANKVAEKLTMIYGTKAHPRVKTDARCDITTW